MLKEKNHPLRLPVSKAVRFAHDFCEASAVKTFNTFSFG